MVKIGAAAKGF